MGTMTKVTDELYDYIRATTVREPEILLRLREKTAGLSNAGWQISPEQGQFLGLLARLTGASTCIEVGTFTGYSALAVALALPADGKLYACDVSDEFTAVGRPFWQEAGVADRIDLRIAPALETLEALSREGLDGKVDLAFIDADKENYSAYYEKLLAMLRPNGLVIVDNVLWSGAVADLSNHKRSTKAIRELNSLVGADERVECSLVPIGDGLLLARKLSIQSFADQSLSEYLA